MRTILIFPPHTGPTYAPLGMACLAAAANRQNMAVDLFDANIALWHELCDADSNLNAMRSFSRGPLGIFLNTDVYAANWQHISTGRKMIKELVSQAVSYLAGDGLTAELRKVLAGHTERIGRTAPELVAFSAMYLDQLPFLLAQAKYLKQEMHAACRTVIGGAAMSATSPQELLAGASYIDAILVGEGELSFTALLKGAEWAQIPGCHYRDERELKFSGRAIAPTDLSELPMPDFTQLLNGGYFNPVPVLPIYGCRGCKWRRCRFCTHNSSFGRYRERAGYVMAQEMLDRQLRFGCRHFYIVDQYVDPVYLEELSDAILTLGLDCRFQIMARTIREYTPELLHKAAAAGCCWISWGMESGSQKLLDIMNKGTNCADSFEVIKNSAAVGISNLLMMIFGAPCSERAQMEETFSFLERSWNYIDGMTSSAFVLFDQTEFGRHPDKYGLEIIGRNPILKLEGRTLYDQKLRFRRQNESGRFESPLAANEVDTWETRKAWLPPLPFHGKLCCEHYLLYADSIQANNRPGKNTISA